MVEIKLHGERKVNIITMTIVNTEKEIFSVGYSNQQFLAPSLVHYTARTAWLVLEYKPLKPHWCIMGPPKKILGIGASSVHFELLKISLTPLL